jgi:hypothetical protein
MKATYFLHSIIFLFLLASCSNSGKNYFTDKANNFKILFPDEPTVSDQSVTFPFGSFSGKKYSLKTTTGLNTFYSVTCVELPASTVHSDSLRLLSQLFALTQMDYLQQFGEEGLMNTWIKNTRKYPGREFVWANPKTNAGHTRRVFYVKNKLYILEVSYTTINQHNVEINTFLDSFELLSKETNPNPEPTPKIPTKKFTIHFPGAPTSRRQVIQGSNGPSYIVTEMYQPNSGKQPDGSGNYAYGVNFTNFQDEAIVNMSEDYQQKFLYENAENSPLILNGGRIKSIEPSTIDGIWCVEAKGIVLNGQLEYRAKTFFKDKYLYQVLVLSALDKSDNPAAKAFMESLHMH